MASRFAVLGSNSFSGAWFVDRLLQEPGAEVLGLSRSPEKSDLFLPYKKRDLKRFRFIRKNVNTDLNEVLGLLDEFRPEIIVNFMAQGEVSLSWRYPEQWYQTNAMGIVRLANSLVSRGYLKRYVHISTPEVYGTCDGPLPECQTFNPSTPYAASKAAGDLFLLTLVRQYKFPMVMIRCTNWYGKHQQLYRIIPRSTLLIKKGENIPLHGGGTVRRSYLHIRDAVEGILLASTQGRDGELYHFSNSNDYSIRDLVDRVCALLKVDMASATVTTPDRAGQDLYYRISSEKARRELGWKPAVELDAGIRECVSWIDDEWERVRHEISDYVHAP